MSPGNSVSLANAWACLAFIQQFIYRLFAECLGHPHRFRVHRLQRISISNHFRKRCPSDLHAFQNVCVQGPWPSSVDDPASVLRLQVFKQPNADTNVRNDITQRSLQIVGKRVQVRHEVSTTIGVEHAELACRDPEVVKSSAAFRNQLKTSSQMQRLHFQVNFGNPRFSPTNASPLALSPYQWSNSDDECDYRRCCGCNSAPIEHASLSKRSTFGKSFYPTHLATLMWTVPHSATRMGQEGLSHG